MSRESLLMVADTERCADMRYAVGMSVPDPLIYLRTSGKPCIVLNDLQLDRARAEAPHCRVLSLSKLQERLRQEGARKADLPQVIRFLLADRQARRVRVPDDFEFALARDLRRLKVRLTPAGGHVFPERAIKTAAEVKKISAALIMAEVGLSEGLVALKSARADRRGRLIHNHHPLTAERLRAIIDAAIVQAGGLPRHTGVAGGLLGCNPMERGRGVLRANEPIVIDISPRSQATGYYGDITRTVVKGRASEEVRRLYHAVRQAQEAALPHLRQGVRAETIHSRIEESFGQAGFRTGKVRGRPSGFLHPTGHGVGLEPCEAPLLGPGSADILRAGHVVSLSPGLYYPEHGGVRLEDLVLITGGAPRTLTQFEKVLEL
jgi:Xaa-Pro aminopeptidase